MTSMDFWISSSSSSPCSSPEVYPDQLATCEVVPKPRVGSHESPLNGFSNGFPTVFQGFSNGFLMVFQRYSDAFPVVFQRFPPISVGRTVRVVRFPRWGRPRGLSQDNTLFCDKAYEEAV